jgi:hypothetical protein
VIADSPPSEAERFARDRGETDKLIVGQFKWCDDFAAARSHAHSLATGDVHGTIDLDDRLVGGEHLPDVMAGFAERPRLGVVKAFYFGPDHRPDHHFRPRLMRARVRWVGRAAAAEAVDLEDWDLALQDGRRAQALRKRLGAFEMRVGEAAFEARVGEALVRSSLPSDWTRPVAPAR